MGLVNPDSLALTLDALNEAFFYGRRLTEPEREEAAGWIAGRQGKKGSYADMFAPTESDFEEGVRLFTGERLPGGGGMAHILGEEACRALILLNVPRRDIRDALEAATTGMMSRIRMNDYTATAGTYCCSRCTPALWRHLAVGGLMDAKPILTAGMRTLKSRRDGEGGWKAFPFHYTLLALSEVDLPPAVEEMRYASPVCESYLKRPARKTQVVERRRTLAERVLERVKTRSGQLGTQ